jgi:hypothetical protein
VLVRPVIFAGPVLLSNLCILCWFRDFVWWFLFARWTHYRKISLGMICTKISFSKI